MSQAIEIRRGTETFRATELAQAIGWAVEGRIVGSDFIFDPAVGAWVPASDHPEISRALAPPIPAPAAIVESPIAAQRSSLKLAVIIVGILLFGMLAQKSSKGDKAARSPGAAMAAQGSFSPSVGSKARLTVSSGVVVVCNTKEGMKELVKLSVANDTLGIANMMLAGRAFGVQPGTQVLIIDNGFDARQVRILEGQMIGRSGWVNRVFLAPL